MIYRLFSLSLLSILQACSGTQSTNMSSSVKGIEINSADILSEIQLPLNIKDMEKLKKVTFAAYFAHLVNLTDDSAFDFNGHTISGVHTYLKTHAKAFDSATRSLGRLSSVVGKTGIDWHDNGRQPLMFYALDQMAKTRRKADIFTTDQFSE